MVVAISTIYEYISIMIKTQTDELKKRKERFFIILVFSLSGLLGVTSIILMQFYDLLNPLIPIVIFMIVLLVPVTIFVIRIYRRQRTITRLAMFLVFQVAIFTALSTILATYFIWGFELNYACNFVFITLILTAGIAAPIEQRITDSEKSYKKLSENLEELVFERTQELEAFSYSVSHDLRTPLRSIAGFSKALKEDFTNQLDDKGIDYLSRIISSTNRMNEIIRDMLELAQISRSDLFIESVNLSKIITEIMNNLSQLHQEQDFEFDIQGSVIAKCDAKLIRIALENLLSNAFKFSKEKSKISVSFGVEELDDKRIFFVKDQGVGFDMKYYDKLFGLFKRLHSNEDFEGTGIGLIIVKRIIDRHKGEVWAESEVDMGATFYFTLSELY
ncbi:MAG: hypothetical protein JJE41_13060 [Candidatus Heimdallarchaeota archaeon]|nr:hypothetical protein [Candidatus Heimdallarchaeota archaeon]